MQEEEAGRMDDAGEIVVFRLFDSAIDANIVKSKLDAYGIPCFLTEENLANLYPGQPVLPFRVRLHLFARDADQAHQILAENPLSLEDDVIRCPNCSSTAIDRDFPKALSATFWMSLKVLFFGIFFPQQKINHCRDCDFEFD